MTSEARPRDDQAQEDRASSVPPGEDADAQQGAADPAPTDDAGSTDPDLPNSEPTEAVPAAGNRSGTTGRRRGRDDDGGAEPPTGRRLSLPLVPTLLVLLLLLLGGAAVLWFTRPEASPVRTGDYVDALQAARSGVVDMTSFDHLTLDDDIEQIRRVATGDLREEAVAELDASRQQITDAEAVVNTEVVGGGVTRADESSATVWLVIQSTQQSNTSPQAQVVRYRIEVELEKPEDRWLLSGIKGTGTENE